MPRDQRISPERAKHLERNRIAANKCRIKKKRENEQIQNTLHNESARRDSLMAEVTKLREQIWSLKNTVFVHAQCNDQHINEQLSCMSENLIGASPDQLQFPSPADSFNSWSDGSVVENGIESGVPSEVLGLDPALYDGAGANDGTSDFAFDRFIDIENV